MSMSVCVCLSVHDNIFGTTRLIFTKFLCMLPMAVARASFGGVVIRYVLPVLCLTSQAKVVRRRRPAKRSAHAALGLAINCAQ